MRISSCETLSISQIPINVPYHVRFNPNSNPNPNPMLSYLLNRSSRLLEISIIVNHNRSIFPPFFNRHLAIDSFHGFFFTELISSHQSLLGIIDRDFNNNNNNHNNNNNNHNNNNHNNNNHNNNTTTIDPRSKHTFKQANNSPCPVQTCQASSVFELFVYLYLIFLANTLHVLFFKKLIVLCVLENTV